MLSMKDKYKLLKMYSLYIININKCRNICIDLGKKNNYEWIFVLDSNSFFSETYYNNIVNNIKRDIKYLIIPQIRINNNNILLERNYNDYINKLNLHEPQIAFKNTSELYFNNLIPYGMAEKAELLNYIGVSGEWNKWHTFEHINIKQRRINDIKFQIISKIIRLNPYYKHNTKNKNVMNRLIGIFLFIKHCQNNLKSL